MHRGAAVFADVVPNVVEGFHVDQRVIACQNYIDTHINVMLLNEAKSCFRRWKVKTGLPTKQRYNELIALPGGKETKGWRDAMRTVLLLELILNEGSPTPPAVVLERAKKEYRSVLELSLRGVIRNLLMKYTKACYAPAIAAMRDAAQKILLKYGSMMDAKYRAALHEVFVEGNGNASNYLYCLRWHMTPADWQARLAFIAKQFNTGGQAPRARTP